MSRPSQPLGAALLAALLALALPSRGAPAQEAESVAPFVPTPMHVVQEMLAMAGVSEADTVYDLGSGDGRVPVSAARLRGALGVGVELDSALVEESRRNARDAGVADRVRFIRGDLFGVDLRGASVVTLYLFPKANARLRPKLLRELDPGDRVVSHDFAIDRWEPDSVARVPGTEEVGDEGAFGPWKEPAEEPAGRPTLDGDALADSVLGLPDLGVRSDTIETDAPEPIPGPSNVYLWVIPARVEGTWELRLPDGTTAEVEIDQRFQELGLTVVEGGFRGGSARIRGREIRLTLEREDGRILRLRGTVRDGRMEGETEEGAGWSARAAT